MQDKQVKTWLSSHPHIMTGLLSYELPNSQKNLSEILEQGEISQKYYLSPKACQGILRRSKERGKTLPERLRLALERQAQEQPA